MIQREDTFHVNSKEVAAKVIDGEAIIINLGTGTYYSTDNVGALAWELAEGGHAFGAMVTAFEHRFSVSPETNVEVDLQSFFERLVDEHLIEVSAAGPAAVSMPAMPRSATAYVAPALNAYRDMDDMLALDPPVPGLEPIPWNAPD